MTFEWDLKKAQSNLTKHGVSFEESCFIFDDPFALIVEDAAHSVGELRYIQIGESEGRIFVVIFTIRCQAGKKSIRIISARKASRRERALYEINKGIPIP